MFENSTKQRLSKLTEQSVKALVAVRLVSLLLECSLVQLLQTETENKSGVLSSDWDWDLGPGTWDLGPGTGT